MYHCTMLPEAVPALVTGVPVLVQLLPVAVLVLVLHSGGCRAAVLEQQYYR
jgi:hypothetical protein